MSDAWTISIRPPFTDDAWGLVKVQNIDGSYWPAESRQDAVARIQRRLEPPRDTIVKQETPVGEATVVIDAHPDYEGIVTPGQLVGTQTGLGTFGTTTDPFANTPWCEHQSEFELVDTLRARPDAVLHITAGEPPDTETNPDGWPWTRSLWARTADEGIDLMAFRANRYDWRRFTARDATFLLRFLQHEWPTAKSNTRFNQFLLDEERDADDLDGVYTWTPEETRFVTPARTPFEDGFDYCPETRSRINGWTYAPFEGWTSGCEQWVDGPDAPETRVILKHHHSEFSFLEVKDDRLGGGVFIPECFPRKSQADYTPAALRDEAVKWMARNPPKQVEHPTFTPELDSTFPGWTRITDPRVGRRNDTITVAHAQPAPYGTVRVLYIEGEAGSTDFHIQLQYRYQTEYAPVLVYVDEAPIELPANVSAAVAESRASTLADRFEPYVLNDPTVTSAIRTYFDRRDEPLPEESGDPEQLHATKIGSN